MPVEVVILAAGLGKRMHSQLPKVLHTVAGRPMLAHLLDTVSGLSPHRIHVVIGHGREKVIETISSQGNFGDISWVEQREQNGTGHAVLQALPHIDAGATVLILNGDTPLLSLETMQSIVDCDDRLNLLVEQVSNPTGMGRIVRDGDGNITGIVEDKDATEAQRSINEVNTNCIGVSVDHLARWLPALGSDNVQNEIYLTDIISSASGDGVGINGIVPAGTNETLGANSRSDLERIERACQRKYAEKLMEQGVTLMDASRLDVRGTCNFGNDCVVDINVVFEGDVTVGSRVKIGPNTILRDVTIGDDCVIEANTVIEQALIGNTCKIGPFARIRPDTVLGDEARIGNFVETKNSRLGKGTKAMHLGYVGDSDVGENVNIGAGVITCNYDGANKHRTVIGNDVFVGSDSQLIAPVTIGDGAFVGAGSTITSDVEGGTLAVSRARQRAISGWKKPEKKTD